MFWRFLLILLFPLALSSCDGLLPTVDTDDGGETGTPNPTNPSNPSGPTGKVVFWSVYNHPRREIDVWINGDRDYTLFAHGRNSPPACGAANTLTLTLPVGVHTVYATHSDGFGKWNGSFAVRKGECTRYEFVPENGRLSLWHLNSTTRVTLPLRIKVDGEDVGTVTRGFNNKPACGASGTPTLSLPGRIYSVTATDANGRVWRSTSTNNSSWVYPGQCNVQAISPFF